MSDENSPLIVEKEWGYETWFVNNELYCAKILTITGGYICSMHRHPIKDETFICQKGRGFLQVGRDLYDLDGDRTYAIRIRPGEWHRFWSAGGMTIMEMSTHHDDADVERRTSSGRMEYPFILWPF